MPLPTQHTQDEHPFIAGFEPAIPAMKRPKTDVLNRRITGIGPVFVYCNDTIVIANLSDCQLRCYHVAVVCSPATCQSPVQRNGTWTLAMSIFKGLSFIIPREKITLRNKHVQV